MLVLSRKPNEQIVVGGVIRITVLDTRGSEVRIGIEAPAGVPIVCDEPQGPPERREDEGPEGG